MNAPNSVRPLPVMVSWSSGKDSAWALHTLRQQPEHYDVRGIFTTVTTTFDRISIHSTPRWVLKLQSERLGLPLYEIAIPSPCTNRQYEAAMQAFLDRVQALPEDRTATHLAFGDLFLEDIRRYREDKLRGTGFAPLFPVWGNDTSRLAETMIAAGVRAIITAGDARLPSDRVGRWFDRQFLADLPVGVDPWARTASFTPALLTAPCSAPRSRPSRGRWCNGKFPPPPMMTVFTGKVPLRRSLPTRTSLPFSGKGARTATACSAAPQVFARRRLRRRLHTNANPRRSEIIHSVPPVIR